jgi:hypothetical protein
VATSVDLQAFAYCIALETVSLPAVTTIGDATFLFSTALRELSLPSATTFGTSAFEGCKALSVIDIPAAKSIQLTAFADTGTTALTVTLGASPPTLGNRIFYMNDSTVNKTVTVRVPSGAVDAYSPIPPNNTTDSNWGNGFRGRGWNGSSIMANEPQLNTKITLALATY